jgi:hypothetical protein
MEHIEKPAKWHLFPMYMKIAYYGEHLTGAYGPYVDKLEAKKIFKQECGDLIHVANVIRILSGPEDLTEADLNPTYLIKATHGSGWNIDIAKTPMSLEAAKQLLRKWNTIYAPGVEKQYGELTPRFFIEQKINDAEHGITGNANTFTIRCVKGTAFSFHLKRHGKYNIWLVPSWQLVIKEISSHDNIHNEYNTMIELAEKLAAPFEFVRIDFYLDNEGRIYFSEYTFTPNGGKQFYPMELERHLGKLW